MKRREFVGLLGVAPGILAGERQGAEIRDNLFDHLLRSNQQTPADAWVVHPTTCTECPAGCGVLVKGREGHPVKLEGDPEHPISGGGLCLRGQASLGRLYHPERIRQPLSRTPNGEWEAVSWDAALSRISEALAVPRSGHAYLSRNTTGALATLIEEFGNRRSVRVLPQLELFNYGALREAYNVLYGQRRVPAYNIQDADLLVTFGADLFESFVNPVRFARLFAAAQDHHQEWYHFEPHLSMTGVNASHRLVLRTGSEHWLLAFLLKTIEPQRRLPSLVLRAVPDVTIDEVALRTDLSTQQIEELVEAWNAAESPLVIVGGVSTAQESGLAVALLSALLQESSGAVGSLVDFSGAIDYDRVGTLNEVQNAVAELTSEDLGVFFLSRLNDLNIVPGLEVAAESADLTVGLCDFLDPPTDSCDIVLPLSHGFESAGDVEAYTGLRGVLRPAFQTLFDTRTEGEILLELMDSPNTWEAYLNADWQRVRADLGSGSFSRHRVETPRTTLRSGATSTSLAEAWTDEPRTEPVLIVTPSVRTYDGRSSKIALINEIPDPLTAVSYGSYLTISEDDASRLSVEEGQLVSLNGVEGEAELSIRVLPAAPPGVFSTTVDFVSGLSLPIDSLTGEANLCLEGIDLRSVTGDGLLTVLSGSMNSSGRGILPHDVHHPPGVDEHEPGHEVQRLYPTPEHATYRWAMAIDLDKCTGCSACVAACYIENNITIAGPEEHAKGREMSWIRVQPYLDGSRPVEFIPLMCQQCSNAPCETVCPVYATYHNPEGLNAQIYNRCVGTRYCANNCPYKARRFNWFAQDRPEPLELYVNPDVSIRPRGVMEKCTFCIQRIREAKDRGRDENRLVRDGEFTTACAQTCPSGAITFGNLLDHGSAVYRLAHSERAYRVLEGLGTEPAVYYLRRDDGHES